MEKLIIFLIVLTLCSNCVTFSYAVTLFGSTPVNVQYDQIPPSSSRTESIRYWFDPSHASMGAEKTIKVWNTSSTPSVVTGTSPASVLSPTIIRNCDDFPTHAEAQAFYLLTSDDTLDGDGDGIACEHLK